ncbi:MAG: 4-(cytidine 5'-diphospho)-2-C-methyl-D-erythritol kinase [Clostridia bacterium]|nr:4-(cytidine 5'-diphospho)-2-C-methyl-D-erythritol kinase [Clostridia bacterium]
MKISIKAAAKVNLLLDLTAVLKNGYHSIYTVMQSVGLYDTITVETTDSDQIKLTCSDASMPFDNRNTAWKAAEFFFEHIGSPVRGLNIHIEKNIPSQAGMGGGSSDAAAVIVALNKLLGTDLSEEELLKIGEKVGADVPFCILGGTRLCLNKGEVMAKLPNLSDCHIVVVKPDQGVSTKEAYSNYDSAQWIRHPDNEGFLFAATTSDFDTMCKKAANVFEQVIEVTDRVRIKAVMRNNNAKLAMMTGSGAAVFGIFLNKKDAEKCYASLKDLFSSVYITEPTKKALFISE